MVKIGISGICGRMGRRILNLARQDSQFEVVLGLERQDCSECVKGVVEQVKITSDPEKIKQCDCLIEFSAPSATLEHLARIVKSKKSLVIGTTGFSGDEVSKIKEAAGLVPIVFSPNMSVGVNLLFRLIKESAKILKDYNIYIEEAHHVHKKDAPSGTAKRIAQIVNEQGFNVKVEDIVAVRDDEIVGDHSIIFKSDVDEIRLFHSANTRDIFAKGALEAAKWIVNKEAGFYSMDDVLFAKHK